MDEIRNLLLKCSVCGNTDFAYDNVMYSSIKDAKQLKCIICNKEYTQEELIEVNSVLISNTTEEIANELIERELKKFGFK